MRVFLSWSGEHSNLVAAALKEWLPLVIQALDPWISSSDIEKGEVWLTSISDSLTKADGMGVFCLTPENVRAPWLAFEAGALALQDRARVATFLYGVQAEHVPAPLGLFQATDATSKGDVFRLLTTLNNRLSNPLPEVRLQKAFEANWAGWEQMLQSISSTVKSPAKPKKPDPSELMEEILAVVRRIERDGRGGRSDGVDSDGGGKRPSGPLGGASGAATRLLEAVTAVSEDETLRRYLDDRNRIVHGRTVSNVLREAGISAMQGQTKAALIAEIAEREREIAEAAARLAMAQEDLQRARAERIRSTVQNGLRREERGADSSGEA